MQRDRPVQGDVLAHLVERAIEHRLEGHPPVEDESIVGQRRHCGAAGECAQRGPQPVEAEHRGVGVVDTRGERAHRHLHQLVGDEQHVLIVGPVSAELAGPPQLCLEALVHPVAPNTVITVSRTPTNSPAARSISDPHALRPREPGQRLDVDALQVASLGRVDRVAGIIARRRAAPRHQTDGPVLGARVRLGRVEDRLAQLLPREAVRFMTLMDSGMWWI